MAGHRLAGFELDQAAPTVALCDPARHWLEAYFTMAKGLSKR